jgi:hypothetical protein
MKVKLAFYKDKGNLIDSIIRWFTKSKYSHVEMIVKDMWISSSAAYGGVHIKELKELSDSYDYVEIEVDGRKLKKVLNFIEENKSSKYDYLGVLFGNVFNDKTEDKSKYFCSEMMVIILKIFEFDKVSKLIPSKTNPGELYKEII